MDKSDIIAIGFLVIGGTFVYTLLKAFWDMLTSKDNAAKGSTSFLSTFKYPLISFIVLILFIIFYVNG